MDANFHFETASCYLCAIKFTSSLIVSEAESY